MPSYRLYGLTIRSNMALPTLAPLQDEAAPCDVELRMGELPNWPPELLARAQRRGEPARAGAAPIHPESPFVWHVEMGGQKYERWLMQDGSIYIFSASGDRIWATWQPQLSLEYVTVVLLGPIMGYLIYLRGMLCMHASAVRVGARAVGLMGVSGAGKSTTSAALAGAGYPLISEDHLALTREGETWVAQPGYPVVRLWQDSAKMLQHNNLPVLADGIDKRYLNLSGTPMLSLQAAPLAKLFLLLPRQPAHDAPRARVLGAQERLMAVMRNSYATVVLNKTQRGDEFARLAQLAADVPIVAITPHSDPARLPDLCELIVRLAAE